MKLKLYSFIIKSTKSGNSYHKQLTFYEGNLSDVNMSKDNRFKAIDNLCKQACFLGHATISFPVEFPVRLHNRLMVFSETEPFLIKKSIIQYRGIKANDIVKPKLNIPKQVTFTERKQNDTGLMNAIAVINWDHVGKLQAKDHGNCCMYCGKKVSIRSKTKDHIIPKSKYRGYKVGRNNLLTSCFSCNTFKDNFYPHEIHGAIIAKASKTHFSIAKHYWQTFADTIGYILIDGPEKHWMY